VLARARNSSSRGGDVAIRTLPTVCSPMPPGVSRSSRSYSSMLRINSFVTTRLGFSWVHRPAACQVDPLVSWPFSSSTASVQPMRPR
jgi:hypothetical protein